MCFSGDIMLKCWNENPKDRPNFENLKKMLCEILGFEEMTQVYMSRKIVERKF